MPAVPFSAERFGETARSAADLLLGYRWRFWCGGDGLGLEGLLDASILSRDPRYESYVYGLLKGWIARPEAEGPLEYTAPGACLLRVYEQTGDPSLLAAAHRHAGYLASFRKTDRGAYLRYEPRSAAESHAAVGSQPAENAAHDVGPCVLVDDMQFDGPFFARLYAIGGEERFRQLAVESLLPSIELLFDDCVDLFHHCWIERGRQRNGVLWGRGNGCAMLAMLNTLAFLPDSEPAHAAILSVFQRQAKSLIHLQDPSGDWHTVLDDPDSYLESSIAALVVDGFSLALHRGWLSHDYRPPLERTLQAVLGHVASDGRLAGVSHGTFPSARADDYRHIPHDAVVPWGQGPLLSALRSYHELVESGQ